MLVGRGGQQNETVTSRGSGPHPTAMSPLLLLVAGPLYSLARLLFPCRFWAAPASRKLSPPRPCGDKVVAMGAAATVPRTAAARAKIAAHALLPTQSRTTPPYPPPASA